MTLNNPGKGKLIIISGPSGAGKSTIVRQLLAQAPFPLRLSISATTRPPRPGEQDGVDYHFVTHDEFRRKREAGEFLECKEVFGRGDWYGTLWSEVRAGLVRGNWVVLEIDVEGALSVLEQWPDAVTIFLRPGSLAELERRLRNRGTESEASLQRRLEVAKRELDYLPRYQYDVINDSKEQAVQDICDILAQCGEPTNAGRTEGRGDRQ